MASRSPKFKDVPKDNRLWRIDGYGGLYLNPGMTSQLSFRATISPLRGSEGKTVHQYFDNQPFSTQHQQTDHGVVAEFGIGELVTLPIGVIFQKKQPQRIPPWLYQAETLTLDFAKQQIKTFNEGVLKSRYLIPSSDYSLGKAWSEIKNSPCICLPIVQHHPKEPDPPKTITHPYGAIVPVLEMARACYGRSSKMLQAIFSHHLPDLLDWIRTHSTLDSNQVYTLPLPHDFLPNDAWVLAWLALDNQAANRACQLMVSTTQNSKGKKLGDSVFAQAIFPFKDQHTLTVMGKWVGKEDQERFLVYRIQEINYPMPYQDVVIRADTDNPTVQDETLLGPGPARNRKVAGPGEKSEVRNDQEPAAKAAEVQISANSTQPFSDLKNRTPKKATGNPPTPVPKPNFSGTANPNADISTGEGTYGDTESRKGRFVESNEESQPPKPPTPKLPPDFETLMQVMELLKAKEVKVEYLPINNTPGETVALFPNLNTWTWIGFRPRRALVVHLQYQERHYYLLEKEHNLVEPADEVENPETLQLKKRVFGYVPMLYQPSFETVDEAALQQILVLWARNGGKWPLGDEVGGLKVRRFKHGYTAEEKFVINVIQSLNN